MTTEGEGAAPAWQQLRLRCREPEAVAEILEACGALAVTFEDDADDPVLEPAPGATPLWPRTRLTGLFAAQDDRADIEARLAAGAGDRVLATQWDALPEQVWERAWLAHYAPMTFGERLRVAPQEAAVPEDGRVLLRLDPGLAFGTGTHPSTALCLHWLGSAELAGRSVIDYGCGSGILGIAAAKLGARSVHGCDIDPQALLASGDNAAANAVSMALVPCAQARAAGPFELVLANILAGTLIELAGELDALATPDATLLLAGLLDSQAGAVAAAFPGWSFERRVQEEWALLVGRRKSRD